MEYPSVPKETHPDSGTFALGDFSSKLAEKSEDARPLDVSRYRMRKDGLQSFE